MKANVYLSKLFKFPLQNLFCFCLSDAICSKFEASLQSTVEVLRGCFVTIPCSFDFEDNYKKDFTDKCVGSWVDNNNLALVNKNKIIGKLQEKNCTTEFKVMKPETSNIYYFRLDCNNDLKYSYKKSGLHFQVKGNFVNCLKIIICIIQYKFSTPQGEAENAFLMTCLHRTLSPAHFDSFCPGGPSKSLSISSSDIDMDPYIGFHSGDTVGKQEQNYV